MPKFCPIWPVGAPSGWPCVLLTYLTILLSNTIDSGVILYQPFLQQTLVSFSGEYYLEAKIWHYVCLLCLGCQCYPVLSVDGARIHIHTHTHTHTSIFFSIYPYILKIIYSPNNSNSNVPQQVHSFYLSIFITSLAMRNLAPIALNLFHQYLLCNISPPDHHPR